MPEEAWSTLIQEIVKASPYALIMLVGFGMLCILFHHSVKELRTMSEQAIGQIREGFKDSMEATRKMYEGVALYQLQANEKKKVK